MAATIEQIAEAFSRHRFAETYAHLAPDVRWDSVGGSTVSGRDAVIAACDDSSAFLSEMTTEFRKFRSVVGSDAVVIDSLAEYAEADGQTSVVASCDIYDFVEGELTTITSYTVEVGEE